MSKDMTEKHTGGLIEACAPVVAVVDALDGVYGFPDHKRVDCSHFGAPDNFNDWPALTWGDLRAIRSAIAKATSHE
jgi:hypothetical protein